MVTCVGGIKIKMLYVIILLIIVGVLVYFKFFKTSSPQKKSSWLRDRCRSLLNMPVEEADQVIDRLVSKEKERNPGKTEDWYLDKILYDLEKDKR